MPHCLKWCTAGLSSLMASAWPAHTQSCCRGAGSACSIPAGFQQRALSCLRLVFHTWTSPLRPTWPLAFMGSFLGSSMNTSSMNTSLSARGMTRVREMWQCSINSTCSVLNTFRDAVRDIKIFSASRDGIEENSFSGPTDAAALTPLSLILEHRFCFAHFVAACPKTERGRMHVFLVFPVQFLLRASLVKSRSWKLPFTSSK